MKKLLAAVPYLTLIVVAVALVVVRTRSMDEELPPYQLPPEVELPSIEPPDLPASVAGSVKTADGTPIVEAIVYVHTLEEPAWAYTDAEGRFRLHRVASGRTQLSVWAREFHTRAFETTAPRKDLELVLDRPLGELPSLAPAESVALRGELTPSFAGRGLKGYQVLLLPAQPIDSFGAPVPRRAEVGADRGFTFDALLLGDYRVVVLPPWARDGTWPNLCAPAARSYAHTKASAGLDLALACATGEVHATVLDGRGRLVSGALAIVSPRTRPDRIWPPATSDEAGSLSIRDLPPDDYLLKVSAGSETRELLVTVPAGVAVEADLPPLAAAPSAR